MSLIISGSTGQDRRRHVRYTITGRLPGVLSDAEGSAFEVLPVDISLRGLGILIDPGPVSGATLTLTINHLNSGINHLVFTVKWTAMDSTMIEIPGLDQMLHCGLELVDPTTIDLVEFLGDFAEMAIEE